MRKVRLVCVGNIKEKFFAQAVEEYAKRLTRFCDFRIFELPEFAMDGGMEREAEGILKHLQGTVVLFDRQGKEVTSEEFAKVIARSYMQGGDTISFVIGGSVGVSEGIKKRADYVVSFGKITYPHRLMRVIATEQIYRAFTIQENLPYHK